FFLLLGAMFRRTLLSLGLHELLGVLQGAHAERGHQPFQILAVALGACRRVASPHQDFEVMTARATVVIVEGHTLLNSPSYYARHGIPAASACFLMSVFPTKDRAWCRGGPLFGRRMVE